MSVAPPELSSYAESLNQEAKSRYIEKIAFIDGVDPFRKVITVGEPYSGVPPVKACDLVSYLVLQTSFITSSQFKARKGLEAYNQFVCGWIKDVHTRKISGKYLTCGRVSHCNYVYYNIYNSQCVYNIKNGFMQYLNRLYYIHVICIHIFYCWPAGPSLTAVK